MKHLAVKKIAFLLPIVAPALMITSWALIACSLSLMAEDTTVRCQGEPGQEGGMQEESCPSSIIEPVQPGIPSEAPGFVLDPEAMIDGTEIQDPNTPDTEEDQTPLPETPVEPTEEDR